MTTTNEIKTQVPLYTRDLEPRLREEVEATLSDNQEIKTALERGDDVIIGYLLNTADCKVEK